MKELSIEEKAKRYNEAIEKFSVILGLNTVKESGTIFTDDVRKIFSKLKESEDEEIRNRLINYFYGFLDGHEDVYKVGGHVKWEGLDVKDAIAWLEKQGEQKPADKVEPKFKVGDFIVNDYCMGRVMELTDDAYLLDTGQGIPFSCEHNTHLWTIQDVKDGDVLVEDSCIFIIQKLGDNGTAAKTYCTLYDDGDFDDGSILYFDIDSTKPATKEQRDTLEKAMADAGYTFDFEKKELKKIEQKSAVQWNISDFRTWQYIVSDVLTKHDGIGQYLDDGLCKKIAQDMQKEWSKKLCSVQHPAAWSEENEVMIKVFDSIIRYIVEVVDKDALERFGTKREELFSWLKSLRPQNRWKPSKGQLECLGYVIEKAEKDWSPLTNNRIYLTLKALKEQLEKL